VDYVKNILHQLYRGCRRSQKLFTITTNMPALLGLLMDKLVETFYHIVEQPVDVYQFFKFSARWFAKNPTVESIQVACWRVDFYGRGSLMKFLSFNKPYHSANVDQPAASRITAVLTESWFRRFQLYRETRSVFHKLLKSMNLRQKQMEVWVVPAETEASCTRLCEQDQR
jgi:hypothetical protein